ncbi:MAG: quinone-dependent dihydroorotate dehydrogenase [Betaproteobacteria bacterium]
MLYELVRPLLFRLDPEQAHGLTLRALDRVDSLRLSRFVASRPTPAPVSVMGLEFPNRVGLAAGLDKNGDHIDALGALGFGFIEIGTVTPRPQPGNPKPRLFRIPQARAIVNRMGFNNDGAARMLMNVSRARYRGILGINIGKNFDTPIERAADDYLYCLRQVYPVASYVTINISSPNTANLRQLQQTGELAALLGTLAAERSELAARHGKRVPLAVKIAPDLDADQVAGMAALFVDFGIDAVIATNTTLSREGVEGLPDAAQAGGLSGAPLTKRSTQIIRQLHAALAGRLPIIAAGGIMSADDAVEKITAGATLVQLYSGLIYSGPALIGDAARAIAASH